MTVITPSGDRVKNYPANGETERTIIFRNPLPANAVNFEIVDLGEFVDVEVITCEREFFKLLENS